VVRGYPRSSAMSPFDRARMIFFSSYASILYRFRDTASYLSKFANLDLPHIHLAPPLGVNPFEFGKDFWRQKTRVYGLSCGRVVCVFLCLAILVEHRLVSDTQTDRQTDTRPWHIPRKHSSCGKNVDQNGVNIFSRTISSAIL